ncbi:hypothetical protein SAMN05216389_101247 [Oceanobacillus limi]|uniref:VCBS repeat-containing protein n=1 Tax=Oceanobacillus limi TaxID=930131 RepID=A0A1H9Y937_9BACI|nr:hypothetical protein [Oceanobacillus limi]SES64952.1 hypothetical protein SAMN05216389_101247 [Oceanobacillus limi]
MKRFLFLFITFFPFFFLSLHESALANEGEDDLEIAKRFLPKNGALVVPSQPENVTAIQRYDFDKDDVQEMIVTYKVKGNSKQKAMVLKKERGKWEKIWDTSGKGIDIDYAGLADITGNGTDEFMIGWMVGASAGSELAIFTWHENKLKKLGENYHYHKLDTLNRGKRTSVVIWDRFCCDAYRVNVWKWTDGDMVHDENMYEAYYPTIEEFYEEKLAAMKAWYYWYGLADAQIKANLLDKARQSIEQGRALHNGQEMFDDLEKELEHKEQ